MRVRSGVTGLIGIGRKIASGLGRWNVRVGRDPRTVAAPALILFPLLPATLCCGLAGILVLRRKAPPGAPGADLPSLFEGAARNDLATLLAGRILAAGYLGGESSLAAMEGALQRLKGEQAFREIFSDERAAARLADCSVRMQQFLAAEETLLEEKAGCFSTTDLEAVNRGLVLVRDLIWGLTRDVLDNVQRIVELAGARGAADVAAEALPKYRKLNTLLNCLDRLEVRGRDSAGIEITLVPAGDGASDALLSELGRNGFEPEMRRRTAPGDLVNGSIAVAPRSAPRAKGARSVAFIYKTASVIGELGRNVRELRARIGEDPLLAAFARLPVVYETAVAHTRWASVGSITEENCHPVDDFSPSPAATAGERDGYPAYGGGSWSIRVALNGDVDNYQQLRDSLEAEGTRIAPEVTTDTKIIPLQIGKYLRRGHDLTEAFRRAVSDFEGSHAIAMVCDAEPGKIFLALRGSGQSIYVGITPDGYLFSSEIYGVVEETPYFVKMDGEKPSCPDRPETAGQILVLDQDSPGGIAGIKGLWYDGSQLPLGEKDVRKAEITTRDIDRGDYPHFFLKEIAQSSRSVQKTLRGKYRLVREGGRTKVLFNLGDDIVPERIRRALSSGEIRRIVVIGHGTAAVAGSAVADALAGCLRGSGIRVEARIASELSGFGLEEDLSDTLVIPITQSGTTTDTNRAVAMASQRGAGVIAVVNRRQSDITTRADGVFYTSDGRDIEMAVASTKAFYSQIMAGHILALFLAQVRGTLSDERIAADLRRLEQAPELMERVLGRREELRLAAERLAKSKRYWAVVGSGPNKAAADEVRIKLSELCYKTISSDVIENKKHIDLSAEPLIIVCAAGNPEAVTGDIVKDVAIFKAHKSAVIVFTDEGEHRFDSLADAVIALPQAPAPLTVILNTIAGHLFGYYAACSIDQEALFLREFKNRLNVVMVEEARRGAAVYESMADPRIRRLVLEFTRRFSGLRGNGGFSLTGTGTIADLTLLLKYAAGKLPLDDFHHDFPHAGEALSPLTLLDITLGHAVDELSRPIDAIRHQAKTVTVGTSRKETPLTGIVFDLLRELAFSARALVSTNVLAVSRIQRAIAAVNGYTLYAVSGLDAEGKPGDDAAIAIVGRGGISAGMTSRVERSGRLIGTKKGIVASGQLYVGRGRSDGAPIVIMPLLGEDDWVRHLLLVHVSFNESLPVRDRKEILGERANSIRDLIQEYNLNWEDRFLGEVPLGILLGEPVELIAGRIKEEFGRER